MKARYTEKMVVRLPRDVRTLIEERAGAYHRSMNSEIVIRLEQSLKGLPEREKEAELEPPFHSKIERMFKNQLTVEEELLVLAIRRLAEGKRRALLELLS
jgi:hypothetical protein